MFMIIRNATPHDLKDIKVLYRQLFSAMEEHQPYYFQCTGDQKEDYILETIKDDTSDIILVEDENETVGFIIVDFHEAEASHRIVPRNFTYIMDLVVGDQYRGKQYGETLMNAAKDWAKESNCDYLELNVLSNNTKAIAFYEKHGYIASSVHYKYKI